MRGDRHSYVFWWAGFVAVLPLLSVGCSRYEYRREADEEAYALVREKSNDPRWSQKDLTIEVDHRSRYFDVYDEVEPPMPPDDPASHQFMHCLDGKKHWPYWHENGDRPDLVNPAWRDDVASYAEITPEGKVKLALEDAVRLALIHSTDFQRQTETVYLSAIDVSTERFRFDVQFFGSIDGAFEHIGEERGDVVRTVPPRPDLFGGRGNGGGSGISSESNQLQLDTDFTAQRRLATAGELLVGFANSTVWEFFGPNRGFTTSLINFSFVQPLLRGGGRVFALEQLTIAERTLLANLRAFERYRHGFFTEIAIGDSGVQGPQRRGGFFGATGLSGFTGLGGGGFGGVGEATGFGRGFGSGGGGTGGGAGTTGFAGGGAGTLGGFLGLLQQRQQIRNSERSLELQLRTLELLEAYVAADLIEQGQVDQFRQSIETERATLLQAQNNFQDALEGFLVGTLNLPPDLPVELEEDFVAPFQFITEETVELQNRIEELAAQVGELPADPSREALTGFIEDAKTITEEVTALLEEVSGDFDQIDEQTESRLSKMTTAEQESFREGLERMQESLDVIEKDLQQAQTDLETLAEALPEADVERVTNRLVAVVADLRGAASELSLVQARTRLERITIDPIVITSRQALQIARCNRLDWMNNRAALVDSWRLIQFNANALKSDLSIRFEGDIQTIGGDNPVKFRDETGTLRASIQFDPPFTRLVERNNFRQQLIEYQQSRRQLIQYEDGVHRTLRQLLRQLIELETNLEIQRRAVSISIGRVDQTREILNQPVPPAIPGAPPPQFGANTAINLLTALSDLRNTQNNFLSVWLNYYATRMVLLRELGIMRVDKNGMWIEDPSDIPMAIATYACDLPPDVPAEWLSMGDDLGLDVRPRVEAESEEAPSPDEEPQENLPLLDPTGNPDLPPPLRIDFDEESAFWEDVSASRRVIPARYFPEVPELPAPPPAPPADPSPSEQPVRYFPQSRYGTQR